MSQNYEQISGTTPDVDDEHEGRVILHRRNDGANHMMSEIGDGVFVAWGDCSKCSRRVLDCKCPGGPIEPPHIELWRVNRFTSSFSGRAMKPALPKSLRVRDRRIAAVMRFLIERGYTITAPGVDDDDRSRYADGPGAKPTPEQIEFMRSIPEEKLPSSDTRSKKTVDDAFDEALEAVRQAKEERDE